MDRFFKSENLGYHINTEENLLGLTVSKLWNRTFMSGEEQLTKMLYVLCNLEEDPQAI